MRAVLVVLFMALAARAEVRVWLGTLTLPTYEEGAPDPNPPFDIYATSRFSYPYTLRENLTNKPVTHDWRAVYLENEYLKCSVLPDIGGHLYTCVDKISGQAMFYANPSIKKANIGYRGAWAAFGIEFNFPVSHNWVSMSPVPFSFAKHDDGSASVTVGNVDRVYGMEWRVELQLRPGSTVLEEHVTLNNRSDVRHRFYWWNNAGVEVKEDSRVCYPMRFTASHGFTDVDTWPVDSTGKDLSVIRNQTDGPVSRFVHGSREPFMGVWRPDTNTGVVHFAEYDALPAKKIWSWGVDADGLDWRQALSDNNSAYVEVQAGLFRNQETYAFLEPRQTIRFDEYWMPVRGLGGIARANLSGVVNLTRRNGTLMVALNVNRKIAPAAMRMAQGRQAIFRQVPSIEPEHTWTWEVPDAGDAPWTFELLDGKKRLLLRQTEGEYDWTPAAEIHTGPQAHATEDDPVKIGTEQELQGELMVALDTYRAGLQKKPGDFALSVAAGRLCASLQRYTEAIRYLQPAAARATSDPEIAYYLGLAYDGAGDAPKARLAYEAAARMPSFRAAGHLKLGELLARAGDREGALEHLRSAGADAEIAVLEGREELPDAAFLGADPERLLNIVAQNMRLGLYRQAVDLLAHDYPAAPADQTEPGAVPPQQYPLVAYYRGYCRAKLGESPAADYTAARKLSTQYVFPSRAEDLEVLLAVKQAQPGDTNARYLLGTYYFARGLTDEALLEWDAARQAHARIPVLHVDIGRALLRVKHDSVGAVQAFKEGLDVDPLNVKLYEGLDESLSLMGRPARELAATLAHYPDLAHMPAELVYALALDRAEARDFEGALALFRDRFFPREEGGTNVRQVWVEVKTMQALADAQADRCSAALASVEGMGAEAAGLAFTKDGLQPFIDDPRTQYMFAQVESRCGQEARATERWKRVAASGNLVWAWGAARKLGSYNNDEWRKRLESALEHAGRPYNAGVLEAALGNREAALTHLQQTILQPDRQMSHHLARMAMSGVGLPQ